MVGDESFVSSPLQNVLSRLGHINTYIAKFGIAALKIIEEKHPDLILADIVLEGKINSIELVKQAKNYDIPLIFVTTNPDEKSVNKAKLIEPYNLIIDPFKIEELKYNFR